MKETTMLSRRATLALLGTSMFLPVRANEPYPGSRPIKLVVPFAPGGGTDAGARFMAERLRDAGFNVVVDNRPGAGGRVGVESALRDPADGYTWIFISSTFAAAQAASPKVPKLSEVVPVVHTHKEYSALVASKKLGVSTLRELIEKAKANPEGLSVGTSGVGSLGHFTAEQFALATGVKLRNVPYRGTGPALADLVSGTIDVMFGPTSAFSSMVRGNMLQGIAVTAPTQIQSLPGVPTFEEAGWPGVIGDAVYGIVMRKGVPGEVVQVVNQAVNQIISLPETMQAFAKHETVPAGGTAEAFQKTLEAEIDRWRVVAQASGIQIQ
jgi:tripartite-type tricarboxylate transporter receptor subunit TctC